jgi:hypothetical protein
MGDILLRALPGRPPDDRDPEPGDCWRYPRGDVPGRECWWIILPNLRDGLVEVSWRTTDQAARPPHGMWQVTGTPPDLTVSPSIDVEFWRTVDGRPVRDGSYWHGWIRDGRLVQA